MHKSLITPSHFFSTGYKIKSGHVRFGVLDRNDEEAGPTRFIMGEVVKMHSFYLSPIQFPLVPDVWMATYNNSNTYLKSGHDYAVATLLNPVPDKLFQQGFVKIANLAQKNTVLNDQLVIAGYGEGICGVL